MNALKKPFFGVQLLYRLTPLLALTANLAAESEPPASPKVTAAMQPYLERLFLKTATQVFQN
jgi:hypothetical protein